MQDAFITFISKFDKIVEILFPPLAIPTFILIIFSHKEQTNMILPTCIPTFYPATELTHTPFLTHSLLTQNIPCFYTNVM
jgi:hypothetical protein